MFTKSTDLTTKISAVVATLIVSVYGVLFVANLMGVNLVS